MRRSRRSSKSITFGIEGLPDALIVEDQAFSEHVAPYRVAASQNQSKTVKVGEMLPLKSGSTPLHVKVVTASGEVIPNKGEPNPFASHNTSRKAEDSVLITRRASVCC